MLTAGKCQKWEAAATEEDKHEINQSEINREVKGPTTFQHEKIVGRGVLLSCLFVAFVFCLFVASVCLFV